jgi:molybdenum cofactor guanylyltransferase
MNAFVLAGGQSMRMGRDKALLPLDGRPLIEHMLDKMRRLGLRGRICGSRPDLAQFADVLPDNFAQAGPLAGIEAALTVSDTELNLFVPVDLPGLPLEFLRWLMARDESSQAVAAIPRFGDRFQPLCAVYSRRLVEGLRGSLAAGHRKVMDGVLASASALGAPIDTFDVECVAATAPADWPERPLLTDWFRNANTPADFEALRAASSGPGSVAKFRHPIS